MLRLPAVIAGLLLLFFGGVASADDDAFSPRTLTGHERGSRHFSSPVLKATTLDGEGAILVGGRGAALFRHRWGIGGGGFTLVSGNGERTLSYGGPALNYIFFPESVVHFDVGLMVAWGRSSGPATGSHGVFLLEPEAHLEVNVTRSFRLALGVGYRHVFDRDDFPRGEQAASGVVFAFGLRFGHF